jgi:hypothetical protein
MGPNLGVGVDVGSLVDVFKVTVTFAVLAGVVIGDSGVSSGLTDPGVSVPGEGLLDGVDMLAPLLASTGWLSVGRP